MDQEDPQKRIADLERQLAEAKAAAHGEEVGEPAPPPSPSAPQTGPEAAERIRQLAAEMSEAWQEHLRTGSDWGAEIAKRRAAFDQIRAESGMSPAQFGNLYAEAGRNALYDREFGGGGQAGPVDTQLAEPPRKIPAAFWLAEVVPFRWWYIWTLFMVGIGLIALWMSSSVAFAVIGLLTLGGIYTFQFWGTTKRFALLKWGQVAQVTGTQIVSRGTYYSGTTWSNAPLPVAHGWKVMRPMYSGPSTKTRISYALNGSQGELMVRGREYIDGVVLADSRDPARALCVTSFSYDLDRDESGNWIGRIRPRLMVGMAVWLIVVIGWLGLVAVSVIGTDKFTGSSSGKSSVSVPDGGSLDVRDNNTTKTVDCNDGHLTLSGFDSVFNVTGHCASLTVSSFGNKVHVESADTITVSSYNNTVDVIGRCNGVTVSSYGNQVHVRGIDTINVSGYSNTVTYHSGSPQITKSGDDITVQRR